MSEEHMKKTKTHSDSDMLPEYDFTGKKGVRGKYCQAYRKGHTVRIHKSDGTITTSCFTLEDGAVMLEPDVRELFFNIRRCEQSITHTDFIDSGQAGTLIGNAVVNDANRIACRGEWRCCICCCGFG
ncbi:MAG: hypothetical protein U9P10_00505 [Thermodesulfobacteriota bacterium]|nr:hypothetical protein [Thermodesulfobacteriota bacterium]